MTSDSVLYRSAVLLNPRVQVHTFEGLYYSVIHGWISRFILTSDTHFLVYALIITKVLENHPEIKNYLPRKLPHTCHLFKAERTKGYGEWIFAGSSLKATNKKITLRMHLPTAVVPSGGEEKHLRTRIYHHPTPPRSSLSGNKRKNQNSSSKGDTVATL